MEKIILLIVVLIITGTLEFLGLFLVCIGTLIVAVLLVFVGQGVILDNLGFGTFGNSYNIAKDNFFDTLTVRPPRRLDNPGYCTQVSISCILSAAPCTRTLYRNTNYVYKPWCIFLYLCKGLRSLYTPYPLQRKGLLILFSP